MAFEVWKPASPGKGGSKGVDYLLRISRNKGEGKYKIAFCLSEQLLREMRWQQGDRVDIAFDFESKLIAVQRNPTGHYTLFGQSKSKNKKNSKQQMCTFRITVPEKYGSACVDGHPRELKTGELVTDPATNSVMVEMVRG